MTAVEEHGKDLVQAASYRPISLRSACYKPLECLALQRISPIVEGILSPVTGCNLIHYSMNNGLNEVCVNCVIRVIMTSCLEQTTVQ